MQSSYAPIGRTGQQGNALLGAIIGISILSAAIITVVRFDASRRQERAALEQGEALAQYAVGLRGFVAAAQSNNALAAGTRAGVDWLKPPSCGGLPTNPASGFVPCSFTGGVVGPLLSTTMSVAADTNAITARASYVVPSMAQASKRSLFADRVAQAARAASANGAGTFYTVLSNVAEAASAQANVASQAAANLGRVVLLVDNAPSQDIYLRTDGTNQMRANFNGGGFSIGNVQDGDFAGNLRVRNQIQADKGLTVLSGTGDFRGGVVTTDAAYTDIGAFASQGVYNAQVYTGATSYNVTKQKCNSTASTAQIFASMQSTGNINNGSYRGDSILESRVDVTDKGTYWQVVPVLIGSKFTISLSGTTVTLGKATASLNPADARIVVMRKCS